MHDNQIIHFYFLVILTGVSHPVYPGKSY